MERDERIQEHPKTHAPFTTDDSDIIDYELFTEDIQLYFQALGLRDLKDLDEKEPVLGILTQKDRTEILNYTHPFLHCFKCNRQTKKECPYIKLAEKAPHSAIAICASTVHVCTVTHKKTAREY